MTLTALRCLGFFLTTKYRVPKYRKDTGVAAKNKVPEADDVDIPFILNKVVVRLFVCGIP